MEKSKLTFSEEFKTERDGCTTLTKENLQKSYLNLKKEGFPAGKRIRFIAELGDSKEIEYHYELIQEDWEKGWNLHLENSFDKHGREGMEFLLKRLSELEEEPSRITTAFLMAEILSKVKHRDFYTVFCDRLIPILVELMDTSNPILRQKVLIAFGWVGTFQEIDLLAKRMLEDEDALCRAWAASSLMQMTFHRVKAEIICENTKATFVQALEKETDLYVCGMILEASQTLFGKKWIPFSAVENREFEKIRKAQKSAIRFLSKQ